MDIEKYKSQVGTFIKQTRQAQKMSQKELITDENGNQIVSEKTLIEIEKGRKAPRPDTLNLLLRKLSKSMLDILVEFENNDHLLFENRFQEIRSLIEGHKYEQAELCYKQLEAENWYDQKNPKIIQALLHLKAVIYADLYRETDLALDLCYESLMQTQPLAFKSETVPFQLDEEYIKATVLSKREYIILINIGVSYADKNELEAAIRICNNVIVSITGRPVEIEMRDFILNYVYFLLSDCLLGLERYHESLTVINQGIELCEKNQTVMNLGYLYFNKGIVLHFLGEPEAACMCFEQSQIIYKALNQQEFIDINKNYAKETYGIEC